MVSLLDCPPELIASIMEHLSVADRRAVILTSKDLYEICKPMLYRRIWFSYTTTDNGYYNPVSLLLRSTIENRQLGGLVRTLGLHRYDLIDRPYDRLPIPSINNYIVDEEVVAKAIREVRIPHGHDLFHDIWAGEAEECELDSNVTLLLSYMPNLRTLAMTGDFAIRTEILGKLIDFDLKDPGSCMPMTQSLEKVDISPFHTGSGWEKREHKKNTYSSSLLFYLPNIQELALEFDPPEGHFAWPLAHPPNPSKLRELRISQIRGPAAHEVFSVCRELDRLVWTICLPNWRSAPSTFDLEEINTALEPFRESEQLNTLMLWVDYDLVGGDMRVPLPTVHGSLDVHDFSSVTFFHVSWPLIMGFDFDSYCPSRFTNALPKNVEYLRISDGLYDSNLWTWDAPEMRYAMHQFLQKWRDYAPRLCIIELLITHMGSRWDDDMIDKMDALGEKYGVSVEVVVECLSDESDDDDEEYDDEEDDDEEDDDEEDDDFVPDPEELLEELQFAWRFGNLR